MKSLWSRHWFLILLAANLFLGLFAPPELHPVADNIVLRNVILFCVLWITGLSLSADAIWQAIKRPKYALLGVAVNAGFLPVIAWGLARLLPDQLALGLIITSIAPCTVASAAVFTRKGGGNDAVAVMVTIITNLGCFLTIPFWLSWTSQSVTVASSQLLHPASLAAKLVLMVVLPMILGQATRRLKFVDVWTTRNKERLSVVAQCGILSMVLIGAIRCGIYLRTIPMSEIIGPFMLMIGLALLLHLVALAAGYWLSGLAGFEFPNRVAVTIAGSQKTLAVGLQLALMVGGGMAVLPMVSYHVIQLAVDSVVADRFASRGGGKTKS